MTDSGTANSYKNILTQFVSECTGSEEKDETGTDEKSTEEKSATKSDNNSTEKTSANVDKSTEEKSGTESVLKSGTEGDSVLEVPVEKKKIPVVKLDKPDEKSDSSVPLFEIDKSDEKSNSSEKSESTSKIYKKFMDGDTSKISLQTVSMTFSTVAYSDSLSNKVKVLETDEDDMKKTISNNGINLKVNETDEEDFKKQIGKCISTVDNDVDNCVAEKPNGVIPDIEKVQKVVENVTNVKEEIKEAETPVKDKEKQNGVIPETEKVVDNVTNEK